MTFVFLLQGFNSYTRESAKGYIADAESAMLPSLSTSIPNRQGFHHGGREIFRRSDAFVDVVEAGLHEPVELVVRQLAHGPEVVFHDRLELVAAARSSVRTAT